jgi:thymidylate synthase (FAD)
VRVGKRKGAVSAPTVILDKTWGSDEAVAKAAYMSTEALQITVDGVGIVSGRRAVSVIVRELILDDHTSTCEHSGATFYIKNLDMATGRQLLRHRMSSPNEASARYRLRDDAANFIPDDWPEAMKEELQESYDLAAEKYAKAKRTLVEHYMSTGMNERAARRRANETSRYFQTVSSTTDMMISINWRSMFNFFEQRLDSHAQPEIQVLAGKMLACLGEREEFATVIAAFNERFAYKKMNKIGNKHLAKLWAEHGPVDYGSLGEDLVCSIYEKLYYSAGKTSPPKT